MNSLLGMATRNQLYKKCSLPPYFEESIHKTIKACGPFDYLVSVNLNSKVKLPKSFITST